MVECVMEPPRRPMLSDMRRRQIVRQKLRMGRSEVVEAVAQEIDHLRQQAANLERWLKRYAGVGHE